MLIFDHLFLFFVLLREKASCNSILNTHRTVSPVSVPSIRLRTNPRMLVSFSIKKMIPETTLEISNWLGNKANSFLEDLGLKEKRVDNSIYDRRIKDLY